MGAGNRVPTPWDLGRVVDQAGSHHWLICYPETLVVGLTPAPASDPLVLPLTESDDLNFSLLEKLPGGFLRGGRA